ncbi:MAG: glycosyltransferase [Opitutae bacterium]|nr:glycosyltransferase [Opitutae bacterium]
MNPPATPPTILAGITTRNRAHILPKALDSLRAAARPGLAVTVIDDASTDATPALRERYPEFRWVRHEKPAGIIESRNELMRGAGTDYFLCLDDDAWFLEGDELGLALARLGAAPAVAGIAFDILSPDRPGRSQRGAPRPVSMFIGCGHLLRLSAVRAAGYYAPSPGTYGSEEKDLCLRLADLGCVIERLPGVHVWHDKAWSGRDNRPLHRSGVCNELVMTLRRCPWPDLLAVLPGKFLSYFWFWVRNPCYFFAGLAAWADFVRHFPAAWRSRRPVRRDTFRRFHRNTA